MLKNDRKKLGMDSTDPENLSQENAFKKDVSDMCHLGWALQWTFRL